VTDGVSHTGVVTFHELSDRLTRVDVDIDIQPGSLLEKAGRGMRHAKRAIRADLARFKAYIELEDDETGAWRGAIEDGKVKSSTRSRSSSGKRSQPPARRKPSSSSARSQSASASSGSSSRAAKPRASSGSKSSGRSSSGSSGSGNGASRSSSPRSKASSKGTSGGGSRSGRKPAASRS
jgi:hypothetical protein